MSCGRPPDKEGSHWNRTICSVTRRATTSQHEPARGKRQASILPHRFHALREPRWAVSGILGLVGVAGSPRLKRWCTRRVLVHSTAYLAGRFYATHKARSSGAFGCRGLLPVVCSLFKVYWCLVKSVVLLSLAVARLSSAVEAEQKIRDTPLFALCQGNATPPLDPAHLSRWQPTSIERGSCRLCVCWRDAGGASGAISAFA